MNDAVYQKREFVIYKKKCGYVVHNTRKPFADGHTHFDSLETAQMVVDWCIRKEMPPRISRYMAISLLRLSTNYKYQNRLKNRLYNKNDPRHVDKLADGCRRAINGK